MKESPPTISVRKVFNDLRKMIQKGVQTQGTSTAHLKNELEENCMGYVLITCAEPSEDGKMQIELSYGGDVTLASYLVDSAKDFFEVQEGP